MPEARAIIEAYLDWMNQEIALCEDPDEKKSKLSTLAYYRTQLGKLSSLLPANLPVEELKAWHLDRSKDRKKRHFCQAAKRVFHWAWKTERIAVCPLRNLALPRARGRKRVLKADEFERILRASQPYFQEYLWALFRTGARPIELRELRWSDVDLEARVLRIVNYKGKRLREDGMKTRDIPFDDEIRELLLARQRDQERFPWHFADKVHIFTGRHGQKLTKSSVCWNFRQACKRAGIDQTGERAVAYTLRHTAATTFTVLGMGQKLLADVLGHSKISTTERYQHTDPSDKVAAIDAAHETGKKSGHPLLKIPRPGRRGSSQQLKLFE